MHPRDDDIGDILTVEPEKCFGCGLCVTRCRPGAMRIAY
jgi:NAD-dependent dihydropyrimidine dehydrogenase PreA subunit